MARSLRRPGLDDQPGPPGFCNTLLGLVFALSACAHTPTDAEPVATIDEPTVADDSSSSSETPAEPEAAASEAAAEATTDTATAEPEDVVAEESEKSEEMKKPETWDFTLEHNKQWERLEGGALGTMAYPPTKIEQPFVKRAFGDAFMGMTPSASLSRKVGTFGAWFGVVRGFRVIEERNETRLLCESKHFDGLTDTHILCLSFNGGGDFVVVLPGTGHQVQPLGVVRVYGTVKSVKDDIPRVKAEYARHFAWGQFTFMNQHGEVAGNQSWRKTYCKVDFKTNGELYKPFPSPDYYKQLLGDPAEFVKMDQTKVVPLD